ncbi:hypothetical protein DPMN_193632 [Dreissena polymorpha]|uniref:Uncharacterized protein n=1 Tax=Dreissena polymorpha TaxID=45954 RepID=A0A9D3Y2B6_DREPO|nr:hypothetical protein DPMN_193632 [Dreissena polymorpha]
MEHQTYKNKFDQLTKMGLNPDENANHNHRQSSPPEKDEQRSESKQTNHGEQ